jgi:hypothetical protein
MKAPHALIAWAILPAFACASAGGGVAGPQGQLQRRELESRTYSTDSRALMRAVLAALQDDGFIVRTADAELGVITATRESAQPANEALKVGRRVAVVMTYGLALLFSGPKDKASVLEATANVARFGSEARVRVNFQLKRLAGSETKEVRTVMDGRVYQEFFAKVDKSLFLQNENLEPGS